jgi:rhodanese-related sulfurtransferase
MKYILLSVLIILLCSCGVNINKGTKVLESMGYTNIKIGSYAFFGCDKNDTFASNFTATGVNGKPVSGALCSGFFKNITVRLD